MGRRTYVLVVLCGCGRIGFDAPASGDPRAAVDARTQFACTAGHDEDGDGVDDCTDVCPHLADPAQADSDGDGVGDLCDPHPALPIDRLAFFDPFIGPRAEWTASSPPTFSGDAIGFDPGAGTWTLTQVFTPSVHRFVIAGHVGVLIDSPSRVALQFVSSPSSYDCDFDQIGAANALRAVYSPDSSNTNLLQQSSLPAMSNVDVQLTVDHVLPSIECSGIVALTGTSAVGMLPVDGVGASSVRIVLDSAPGSFDYFLDITSDK